MWDRAEVGGEGSTSVLGKVDWTWEEEDGV